MIIIVIGYDDSTSVFLSFFFSFSFFFSLSLSLSVSFDAWTRARVPYPDWGAIACHAFRRHTSERESEREK